MIFRNRVAKTKLVEQLTLVTLQTAHHGSTSPRIALPQRNHGSRPVSTDFCNKICQHATSAAFVRFPTHEVFLKGIGVDFFVMPPQYWVETMRRLQSRHRENKAGREIGYF